MEYLSPLHFFCINVRSRNKFDPPNGELGSSWLSSARSAEGKLPSAKHCKFEQGKRMRNKQSDVRHIKKQSGMQYKKLVQSGCKLRYRTGRTAVTGRQRSDSAGRFRQGFPKKSENGFVYHPMRIANKKCNGVSVPIAFFYRIPICYASFGSSAVVFSKSLSTVRTANMAA